MKCPAELLLDAPSKLKRGVEVVHPQLDAGDVVAFVEELLCLEEIGVEEAGIVLLKPGLKDTDHPKLPRTGRVPAWL